MDKVVISVEFRQTKWGFSRQSRIIVDKNTFEDELTALKTFVHGRIEMYLNREMIDVVAALREVKSEIEFILEKPSTFHEMILRSKIPMTFFEVGQARIRAKRIGLETFAQLVALNKFELKTLLKMTDRSIEKIEAKLAKLRLELRQE